MKKDAAQIDLLNIGLIFVSLLVAINLPFHLFLFAYAVLGPLHYLTEIGWLNKQSFFMKRKSYAWFFVAVALIVATVATLSLYKTEVGWIQDTYDNEFWSAVISDYATAIFFISLIASAGFLFFKDYWKNGLIVLSAILLSAFLYNQEDFIMITALFLPTLIHVYIFTALFMLYGALKSKSVYGFISVGILLLCTLAITVIPIHVKDYIDHKSAFEQYTQTNFHYLAYGFANYFGLLKDGESVSFLSEIMIRIQIFIAFAYTYHYLNWFSKTSIIKWHKIPKQHLYITLSVWVASVSLYYYDYKIGFVALLFLSFLHVFLEFPLNVKTVLALVGLEKGAGKK